MMVNSVLQILTVDCVEVELENTALASDRAVVSTQPQDNFDSRLEYIHMGTFSLQQQQQPSGPQTADLDLSCVSSAEGSESSGLAEEAENSMSAQSARQAVVPSHCESRSRERGGR